MLASSQAPPSFSMLHAEKWGSLVSHALLMTYVCGGAKQSNLFLQSISFPAQLTFTSKRQLQKVAVRCSIFYPSPTLPMICTGM